jgi:quercetin dioxygenase-like cupin family protein
MNETRPTTPVVTKRWGYEETVHLGTYWVKRLTMFAGCACSWHHHERKHETLTVLDGQLRVEVETGDLTPVVKTHTLRPGESLSLSPGVEHRMSAPWGMCVYLESSTPDDEAMRTHAFDGRQLHVCLLDAGGIPYFVNALRQGIPLMLNDYSHAVVKDGCEAYGIELVTGVHPMQLNWTPKVDRMAKVGDVLPEEYTFQTDGEPIVAKWFRDPARAVAVVRRWTGDLKTFVPQLQRHVGGWLTYRRVVGRTAISEVLVEVLDVAHWRWGSSLREDRGWSTWFLHDRTMSRLERFNPTLAAKAKEWGGWRRLTEGSCLTTRTWHGDLSFENVIFDDKGKQWWIDPHEAVEGDVHYDLAKLYKSLDFDHRTFAPWEDAMEGKRQLEAWVRTRSFDWDRVLDCFVVVVLKMAGAHNGPLGEKLTRWAVDLMHDFR